jgi:hypothetical protein
MRGDLMATAEEILMAAATDDIITIDSDLRTINIPPTIKLLGVESDKDVRRLNFKMPATYGDIDLSGFDIRINYVNANARGDVYEVEDEEVEGDHITFSWLVGRFALQHRGTVRFIVCLRELSGGGDVLREFNTTVASLPVLEGLEPEVNILAENPDMLEKILKRLYAVESGTVSDIYLNELIVAYLAEHPVAGPPGKDGKDGKDGADGKDGRDGQNGVNGVDGQDGRDGADGKSAYAYAKEGGYTGTETEFTSVMARLATIQVYNGEKEELK